MDRKRIETLARTIPWKPQRGPQFDAFVSKADQVLYGGAAGGGKTALAVGLAVVGPHKSTLIVRRQGTELVGVVDELERLIGNREGFNASLGLWRLGDRTIRLGGVPNLGDEAKFQGAPRDLLVIDEAASVLESQARFLLAWLRSTNPRQRCRALFCSNPPTAAEGEWLVRWWAPWLDPTFPNPAKPGELRWVAMIPGEGERWVDGPQEFTHGGETIRPLSRTFIPSRVTDNLYLKGTGYERQLAALPEPLRSQMLHGDFSVGRGDDEWTVIPSAWVKLAMDRYTEPDLTAEVTSVGVDPSRGGSDETIIAVRRGWRFDPLIAMPGEACAHGGNVAHRAMTAAGERSAIHVDVIGIGASVIDHLDAFVGSRAVPVNFAAGTDERDATGNLAFVNVRAQAWWRMRELLDPTRSIKVSLPKDHRLLADLSAPRYRITSRGIQCEDKQEIRRRLGRSPDRGDAVVLAALRTAVHFDNRSRSYFTARRSTPQFLQR